MRLLKAITAGIERAINVYNKPKSFEKGEEFETFTREKVFIKEYYECTHKTHDYQTNKGDYIKDSLEPDFKFIDRIRKKQINIECKYRSILYNKIYLCSPEQLQRYKMTKQPTYILLGTEGTPNNPKQLHLIPTKGINYNDIFRNRLEQYEINEIPIKSYVLWKISEGVY